MENDEKKEMCEACGKYIGKYLIDETHYVCGKCFHVKRKQKV